MKSRLLGWASLVRRRWPIVLLFTGSLVIISHQYCTTLYHKKSAPRGGGTYKPYVAVQDGHMIYLQAMSVVYDRDLDITDEVAEWGRAGYRWKADDGRPFYPHAIGPVIVWAPMLAVAQGTSKIANALGADIAGHGYTLWHQRWVLYTSVIAVLVVAFLGYRVSRRLLGDTWAPPLAAIAILFGSNLGYYATERPDYGHALSAAMCAVFLAYWIKTVGDRRWQRYVWLGVLLGLAGLARTANVGLGLVVAIEIAWIGAQRAPLGTAQWRWAATLVGRGFLALAVAFVTMVPQFLAWKFHYETGWFTTPHGSDYVHLGRPMLSEFLWSSHNGYLSTHPLIYAGVVGLLMLPRRWRLVGVALFVCVLSQAYINSCVYDWWGMGSFGARRMMCMSLAIIVGLAAALRASALMLVRLRVPRWPRRIIGVGVLAWFVWWNQCYDSKARDRRKSEPLKICCEEVPGFMEAVSRPVHRGIGNPFSMPASALFAWRHGGRYKDWGKAVTGDYAARPKWPELMENRVNRRWFNWNIPGVNFEPYLSRGMGPRQQYWPHPDAARKKNFRWTTAPRGSVLVPLFLPSAYQFNLQLHGNLGPDDPPVPVTIELNGRVISEHSLPFGWQRILVRAPAEHVRRGINVLTFRVPDVARSRVGPGLPDHPRGAPVGLGVMMMKIQIADPVR